MPKEMTLSNYAKGAPSVNAPQHSKTITPIVMEDEVGNVVPDTNQQASSEQQPIQKISEPQTPKVINDHTTPGQEPEVKEHIQQGKPVALKSGDHVLTPTPEKGKKSDGSHTNRIKEDPRNGARRMTASQVQAARVKAGIVEEKKEEVEDAPIVANAFKALNERIERSKKEIDEIMMPIVYQNAQEIALENQMKQEQMMEEQANQEVDSMMNESSDDIDNKGLIDLDPEDFSELEDNSLTNTPVRREQVTPKPTIDPSEQVYDFDSPNDESESEPEMAEESTELLQPMEETQEEEPELIAPIVEEAPKPKVVPEPKPTQPKVVNSGKEEIAGQTFKIETENSVKEDADDKAPELSDDTIIDMNGNKVSLAKAMADLDKDDDATDEEAPAETQEEIDKKIKKQFESTKIIQNPEDLSKFKIRKKAVSSAFILNAVQNNLIVKKADWVLYHTGRAMRFTECIGPELDNLRKSMNAANRINRVKISMQFIYDHVEDAAKPPFEEWCRLYRTEDINSGYFGIYKANYSDTNLIARTCPHCKKTSLIDTNIDDMVIYGLEDDNHDKIKEQFMNILRGDTTSASNSFRATLTQISDNFAVSYSPASIYSTFIQYSTLKDSFMTKYADLLDMLAHIDTFFYIDKNTQELVPIVIKEYPNKLDKTIMSRIQTFHAILKTLSLDQYNAFNEKMDNVIKPSKINYRFPKAICPECGKEIPEEPIDSMLSMLFMRAQLARIKSS